MTNQINILLVGCGKMGGAMLNGWQAKSAVNDVVVVSPLNEPQEGATVVLNVDQVPSDFVPNVVLFAVKPQMLADVVPLYNRYIDSALFISVAAGKTLGFYEGLLDNGARIIRTMPNTPSMIGQGVSVSVANAHATEQDKEFCDRLMTSIGAHHWLDDEGLMDAVTAVSGSGPAYIFHFVEAFIEAASKLGLPDDLAKHLAVGTVVGSANYVAQAEQSATQLRENVTSPNGTTAAALAVLMDEKKLQTLLCNATSAARDRSVELK